MKTVIKCKTHKWGDHVNWVDVHQNQAIVEYRCAFCDKRKRDQYDISLKKQSEYYIPHMLKR